MVGITDEEFEKLVGQGIDSIPSKYAKHIKNLAFVVEDDPSEQQRIKLGLHCNQTLYGLYEGIPITRRASNYNLVLPDKITIFKNPILRSSQNFNDIKKQVNETIWHEVAHYFGLDHDQMHDIKNNRQH